MLQFSYFATFLQKDPERRTDLSDKNLQSSSLTPVRNPFKVKTKQDKSSEHRRDLDAEKDRREVNGKDKHVNGEDNCSAKKKEGKSKSNEMEGTNKNGLDGQSVLDREGRDSGGSESWRNKTLPAGMKIKKRVSNDERPRSPAEDETCPESPNSVKECVQRPSESETSLKEQQEQKPTKKSGSSTKSSSGSDMKTSENKTKDDCSNKQSTSNSKSVTDKPQNLQSKSQSPSCSTSQDVPVSEKPSALNVQKTLPNQSQEKDQKGIARFGEWSDEDDDVQLVSVQPPTQQSAPTPVAPVQKTLTSFPGFQAASKAQVQSEDLHSHLTAQLKQKKVTRSLLLFFLRTFSIL